MNITGPLWGKLRWHIDGATWLAFACVPRSGLCSHRVVSFVAERVPSLVPHGSQPRSRPGAPAWIDPVTKMLSVVCGALAVPEYD